MFPYYILVFIPFILYIIGLFKGKKYNKLCISVFFIILIIMLSLRSIETGTDLKNYKFYFDISKTLSFSELVNYFEKGEFLYFILNKIISIFSNHSFQIFLTIVALLSIVPIFKLYYKKTDNALLTIALFLTIAPFSMFFSGLRQCIAIGIIIFAFKFVEEKKPVKFLLCILLGYYFHRTVIFCLPLYPLYHVKITTKWLYIIIPIMMFIFVFNQQIFSAVLSFVSLYDGEIESTGAYSILILLVIFAVYCFAFPDKDKIDKEFIGLRNILLMAVAIQMFAPIHTLVMRINYYYLLFIPILIPKVIKNSIHNIKILKMSVIVITLFFTSYFFYLGYYGNDTLNIFPYVPYWEVQ